MTDEEVSAQFEWFHQLAALPPDELAQQASPANQDAFAAFVLAHLPGNEAPPNRSPEEFVTLILQLRHSEKRWNQALMAALIEADDLFKAGDPSKAASQLQSFADGCPWQTFQQVALDQSSRYMPRAPEITTHPMSSDLDPRSLAVEVVAAVLLFGASLAAVHLAVADQASGKPFRTIETAGIAIIFFSGCFDPVNWIWRLLPFTKRDQIMQPPPWAKIGWIIFGIGWVVFVVGLIGKYMHHGH